MWIGKVNPPQEGIIKVLLKGGDLPPIHRLYSELLSWHDALRQVYLAMDFMEKHEEHNLELFNDAAEDIRHFYEGYDNETTYSSGEWTPSG